DDAGLLLRGLRLRRGRERGLRHEVLHELLAVRDDAPRLRPRRAPAGARGGVEPLVAREPVRQVGALVLLFAEIAVGRDDRRDVAQVRRAVEQRRLGREARLARVVDGILVVAARAPEARADLAEAVVLAVGRDQ